MTGAPDLPVRRRYCTVQSRWVQVPEKACHSASTDRISRTGRLPNLTIFPVLTGKSWTLAALASFTTASETSGGLMKRTTG